MIDLSETMREAADYMYYSVMLNFMSGGRPSRWLPTKAGPASYLIEKGDLRSSIRQEYGPNFAKLSTSWPYAFTHQMGWPQRNIPQRKYMLFQDEDVENLKQIVMDGIMGDVTDAILEMTQNTQRLKGSTTRRVKLR